MRHRVLPLAIAIALASTAQAQQATDHAPDVAAVVPMSYVGTDTRVSLGIDDDVNVMGELMHVFANDGDSSWVGEAWFGQGGEGGIKFDYHWLWGGRTREDSINDPDKITVAKVFGALDQNVYDDRKATIGVGMEREHLFLDAYASSRMTGTRFTGSDLVTTSRTITGADNGRPFTQTIFTDTLTEQFAKPYDWGLGVRAGRYFGDHLARLRAGVDYEDGDYDSNQFTLSLGVDKYFANSGHSVTVELENYFRDGDFETDENDTRGWLLWRYEFGQSFRATEPFRMVEVQTEVAAAAPAAPVVMRNEVRMGAGTFFVLDRSELSGEEQAELLALVDTINSDRRISRISVTGHTCDLGSDAYNQALSLRRANAVRDFLIAQGVSADEIDVSGEGEANPKFPNDGEENRHKNRRVDLNFLTVEQHTQEPEPVAPETQITWERQPVAAPAAWIERAMRNPAEHKRTVDAYRFEKTTTTERPQPPVFINRGPTAVNDALALLRDAAATAVPVLANDTDPDGDTLSIVSATTPTNGTATITGSTINYTPRAGFVGTDNFNYTISDGHGGSSTAIVTITVSEPPPPPPPANNAPIAVDDYAEMDSGQYALIQVLLNDSDPDGDTLTVTDVTQPANGHVRINFGKTILYLQNLPGYWGTDTFTYTISDGHGGTATATVRVRVIDD